MLCEMKSGAFIYITLICHVAPDSSRSELHEKLRRAFLIPDNRHVDFVWNVESGGAFGSPNNLRFSPVIF